MVVHTEDVVLGLYICAEFMDNLSELITIELIGFLFFWEKLKVKDVA